MAQVFSFEDLCREAREIAAAPYRPSPHLLAEEWKGLSYDDHRDISFRVESGLWWGPGPFSIDFFHPGWTAREIVEISEVDKGVVRPIAFDPNVFDYKRPVVPEGTPPPPGYAGWRARARLNWPGALDEFLVFLGASYFRAIPAGGTYGLSARGISINSGLYGVVEEFPQFTRFYIDKPAPKDSSLTAYALLEGESVAGAYRFTVTPGQTTTMEIEAELTLRQAVQQLGLAPLTSMFWYGEGSYPKAYDFRPEIHDSDALLIETGEGEWHLRPLEMTRDQVRHCVFSLDQPRSWALLQRDRAYSSYLDLEALYHRRPTAQIVPLEGFSRGKLHLIELPTGDETNDNIVLTWEPETPLEIGKTYRFRYRINWLHELPANGLFQVRSTRMGHPVQLPQQVLMMIEFAKPLGPVPKKGAPKWENIDEFEPVVTMNRDDVKLLYAGIGDVSRTSVDEAPRGFVQESKMQMPQRWRVVYAFEPGDGVDEIDFTCELRDRAGKVVSEKWVYLWRRPSEM